MRQQLSAIACLAAVVICGCAGIMDSAPELLRAGPWWKAGQADHIGSRARELETRGELTMALDHWRLAQRVATDQATARGEIRRLENKITMAVQDHYQKGLAALEWKKPEAARNHFLAALRLAPTFQPALKQIRARFSPFPLAAYLSVPGDRPSSVAENVLGDREKAFLVAWFNDLADDDVLPPGTLLILPRLKQTPLKKTSPQTVPDPLTEARKRLAENDLDGALTLAEQAEPTSPGVQALIHTIHLHKAMEQIESGQLDLARQSIDSVPDGVKGRNRTLEQLRIVSERRQLALDLAKAREIFERGEYERSLDLAEALAIDAPYNAEATALAAEARYRLAVDHVDHKRFIKARAVLERADQGHKPSAVLKETVRVRLVQLGQEHYRNGVKHFINENLLAAISEWEKSLACNPDQAKAGEDIQNARRLLDKIERLP